jgi:hypothetical protein
MRRGLSIFRKCGRSMKREVSADGYADVTEVLRKRIERFTGS